MNPDEVKANVQKLIDAGASDEDIHGYITAAGYPQQGNPINKLGLAQRQAAQPQTPEEDGPGYFGRLATHVLNTAQGIPGMEAVEAGAGMLGSKLTDNPMSYEQSLNTLRDATGNIGGKTSAFEHIMGSAATLPFLAASPVLAGAELGGADGLLSADNESLAARATHTAIDAGTGALLGKGADMLVGAGRGLLAVSPAKNLLDRAAARAASAKRLYTAALDAGKGKTTPEIQAYVQEPDIAEIVSELQKTREFKGVAPESPEMLDAIYKTLSDRGATIKKGLMSVNPNKPNIGRFQSKDIAAAQAAGLEAMDTTMPGYRAAVQDFAKHKAAEDAVARGYDALRSKLADNLPTAKNLTRTTPEAFSQWAENAGRDETKAAVEGILGATKMALKKAPFTSGRKALMVAPSLLRSANDATAQWGPKAGLLALRNRY